MLVLLLMLYGSLRVFSEETSNNIRVREIENIPKIAQGSTEHTVCTTDETMFYGKPISTLVNFQ